MPHVTVKPQFKIEGNTVRFRTPDGRSLSISLIEEYDQTAPEQLTDMKIYLRRLEDGTKQLVVIFPDGREQILLTEAP